MIPLLLAAALAPAPAAPSPTTVAAMRWQRRVLVMAAPRADDPALVAQRRALAGWDAAARERDLTVVTVIGDRVTGAADTATALRRRYRMPSDRFAAVLIGKDGGVKLRKATPIAAEMLAETIDAMPMRRAGER